ncbi:MAG: (deoxy)nucleoside triphosphate pyrophosphohydrolase [Spirochaetaceae bacterium]|jgi:8-oxo-dGTP diphosphatase|nr:(deoxy)nucleoside triphosphate pyrophosphohydrolase [Spirochaetaceae bacterium]
MKTSVAGLAIENGKVFIARRLAGGDMGGKWEFPGGKVEENESCEEAIVREFLEEFGVRVRCGALLAESHFEHHDVVRTLKAYRVCFSPRDAVLREHSEWRWASAEEIGALDFTPSDLALLPLLDTCSTGP